MSEHYFKCPKCGGHYFGRDVGKDLGLLDTVQCHNADDGTGMDAVIDRIVAKFPRQKACGWKGEWPVKETSK